MIWWTRFKAGILNAWTLYQVPIIVGALVVLLIFGVLFKDWIGGQVHRVKRWWYNTEITELQGKNKVLESENQKLREQIEQDIAKGKDTEIQIDALESELERFGKQGKEAVKAQQEAASQYEKDLSNINSSVSLYQRCLDYCGIRSDIGKPCKPTIEQYCQSRYAGR